MLACNSNCCGAARNDNMAHVNITNLHLGLIRIQGCYEHNAYFFLLRPSCRCFLPRSTPARAGVVIPPSNSLITDAGLLGEFAGEPDVFARGSSVYAVWRDGRRTDSSVESDIYFASSSDGGATWGQNRRASATQILLGLPMIQPSPSRRMAASGRLGAWTFAMTPISHAVDRAASTTMCASLIRPMAA